MKLFAFGSNGSGQLGIGHEKDVSVPTNCKFLDWKGRETDLGRGIARIVAGGNHTLVHMQNGQVYASGHNEDGRCGFGSEDQPALLTFHQVIIQQVDSGQLYQRFKHVAATWETSFFVTHSDWIEELEEKSEKVFTAGTGSRGQMGIGEGWTTASLPLRVPYFPPDPETTIVAIAGGLGHVVAILSNGEAHGWGTSRKGELGSQLKDKKSVWIPEKIEGVPFHVTDVTCGRDFTVLSGNKAAGEFMILGADGDKWNILTGVPDPSAVAGYLAIDASWHGVYVHQRDLSVLAWGKNDQGQLPPADLQRVKKLAVGSEHALALREDGTLVAFGWGEHGNCGPVVTDERGQVMARFTLQPTGTTAVVDVWAGCATSFVLFRDPVRDR